MGGYLMVDELSKVTSDSARGGFFLFSGAALASVITAISAILVGRFLGPELYGQYNLVLVIPTLLLLFTDLGLNAAVTKFVASFSAEGKHDRAHTVVRYGMLFRLGIGIVVSVISLVFASYFALLINRADLSFFIQLACLSVIFQVIFTTANSAFVGYDRSEYNALLTTVQAVVRTVMQIVLVLVGFSLGGALVGYVGGFLIAAIIGAVMLFFKLAKPAKTDLSDRVANTGSQILRLLARYGLPVYIAVILTGFFPLYQQMVLAFFSSDIAIGNFRASYNFVVLLTVLTTSITTALLPAFSKLESATPEVISAFFNKANKYTCLIIIPITICSIVFSGPIVELLYGAEYTTAALFLSLNCTSFLLTILGFLTLQSVFNGLNKTRLTMNMTLINFVLLLVLTPILAPLFDVVGVIVAYLISAIVASVYAVVAAVRKLKMQFRFKSPLLIYLLSTLAALPSLLIMYLIPLSSLLFLVVGAIVYLAVFLTLLPLLKIMDKTEFLALGQFVTNLPLIGLIAKPLLTFELKICDYISRL
jgi:stage V sporulation protein B